MLHILDRNFPVNFSAKLSIYLLKFTVPNKICHIAVRLGTRTTFEVHNYAAQETTKQRKSRTISNQNYAFAIATQIFGNNSLQVELRTSILSLFFTWETQCATQFYIIVDSCKSLSQQMDIF